MQRKNRRKRNSVFRNKTSWSVGKLFHPRHHANNQWFSALWTFVVQFLAFFRRTRKITRAMPVKMVFSIIRVDFNRRLQQATVFVFERFLEKLEPRFWKLKNRCFSAETPRPRRVLVTKTNKRDVVQLREAPVHCRVAAQTSFDSVNALGFFFKTIFQRVKTGLAAENAEPRSPRVCRDDNNVFAYRV